MGNQQVEKIALPSSLQSLTFGQCFNHGMANVALPRGLRRLTFGHWFNQSMDKVALPSGLQSLTFGQNFNYGLKVGQVGLFSDLQSSTFGHQTLSLETITVPAGFVCSDCRQLKMQALRK